MKRIRNGWLGMKDYNCFGCCPSNPVGLRMEFYEDGDDIVSLWTPRPEFQGWIGVLHGGIQATLCDEIASWVVFRKLHTTGVTARMEVRYHKSISVDEHHLTLRARLVELRRKLADIEVTIHTPNGTLCTSMQCTYMITPPQKAAEEGFPEFGDE